MSECVVRMEMPENCYVCEMRGAWAFCPIGKWPVVGYKKQRHEDCPIVAVLPEKHGRLVDADANFLGVIHLSGGGFANYNTTIAERLGEEDMRMVKVIVPAERSET